MSSNLMRQLPDTKWLRQIVMPGSHDAGVYGTAQTVIRTKALVKPESSPAAHAPADDLITAATGLSRGIRRS